MERRFERADTAYSPRFREEKGVYGEVYVNCDRALKAAPKRAGWSPAKELLLYIAHGIDHLSGADDFSPKDYQAMRRRELSWINDLPDSSVLGTRSARLGRFPKGRAHPQGAVTTPDPSVLTP